MRRDLRVEGLGMDLDMTKDDEKTIDTDNDDHHHHIGK